MIYVLFIIGIALVFDFINGMHDSANSIATVVSTRVLSPLQAVFWAAFFNFVAAFVFGTAVAKTIGADLIDITVVNSDVVLGGLLGAIAWNLITWYFGIPSSSSHALIGGYAGAAVARVGIRAIVPGMAWVKTLSFIVLSPLIGMAVGWALDGRDVVALPQVAVWIRGPLVPPRAARLGGGVLAFARHERRAEDDGHHRRPARRQPRALRGPGLEPALDAPAGSREDPLVDHPVGARRDRRSAR